MRVFLIFASLIGVGLGISVPHLSRSGTSDPCSLSPCAKNAICESPNGLAFCRCQSGFTGDALVSCKEIHAETTLTSPHQTVPPTFTQPMMNSGQPSSPQSQSSVKVVSDVEVIPGMFTVEYHTVTDNAQQDMSRVPILGSTQAPFSTQRLNHNRVNAVQTPSSVVHETLVHTHIQRHRLGSQQDHSDPPKPSTAQFDGLGGNYNPTSSSTSSLNDVVSDPMGQYTNCRSINGVIVCADNSVDDSSKPSAPKISHEHSLHQVNPNTHRHNQYVPDDAKNRNPDCKSMCGINSVCRMINNRPVCGCPVGHTGDPGVRCDPIAKQEEMAGCQKHTECAATQTCANSKCIDPCNSNKSMEKDSVAGMSSAVMCGNNAKCTVIQHTPLCGCMEGFNGNPYLGCVV